MKQNNHKDFNKRVSIEKFELILLQQKISKRLNYKFLKNCESKVYNSRIKNRCVLTARSKAIYSDFKLSRIKIRELGLNGLINGFKKISW